MQTKTQIALDRINKLDSSEFKRICALRGQGKEWQYVGSNSRSSGRDAHWISLVDEETFVSITSSIYGEGEEYMLIQDTSMDLGDLKKVAASVIPFGDSLAGNLDPSVDEQFSEIIWNIAHSLPAHGGYNDIISNPKLSQCSEELGIPVGEALIDKVFANAVAGWDVPV